MRRTEFLRPEALLSVRAVAERLGLCAATVHNDINAGRLRWVLFGSLRRVRPEDFEAYAKVRALSLGASTNLSRLGAPAGTGGPDAAPE